MSSASDNRLAALAGETRAAREDARQSAEYSAQRACDTGERLMEARDRIGADLARGGTTTLAASFNLNEDARGDVA